MALRTHDRLDEAAVVREDGRRVDEFLWDLDLYLELVCCERNRVELCPCMDANGVFDEEEKIH